MLITNIKTKLLFEMLSKGSRRVVPSINDGNARWLPRCRRPLNAVPIIVGSVEELMDRFYKFDRLNRPGGMRELLIADREECMKQGGLVLMISHYDSATGMAIYAHRAQGGIVVTQS